jgi:hypothetical protein
VRALTIYNTSDYSKVNDPSPLIGGSGVAAKFSPNGSLLAVGSQSATPNLRIYDTTTWTAVSGPTVFPGSTIWKLDFSPN